MEYDEWSTWVFRCWFASGERGRLVVHAACEYDAWVSFSVLSGIQVSFDGLERW